jgi:hypothetical protein
MAEEDRRMRDGHAGTQGGVAGRDRAMSREVRWQRWLWLRFLVTFTLWPLPGPWGRFIRYGGVTANGARILDASRPTRAQWLWGAVASGLAAQTLGLEPVPVTRPRRFLGLGRLLTLAIAVRELAVAGFARATHREWRPTPPKTAVE